MFCKLMALFSIFLETNKNKNLDDLSSPCEVHVKQKTTVKGQASSIFASFSFFFWNKKPLNSLVPFLSLYVIESTKPSRKLPLTDFHFKQTYKGKQLDAGVLGQMTENVHYCKSPYIFC